MQKIHADIGELLEERIYKEVKNYGDIRNFYLSSREQTTLTITKQFSETTQELWSLYRSLRVPKMVRVNLIITNNVKMVNQRQSTGNINVQGLITKNYMLMINNKAVALMGNELLKELYRAKHKAQWLSQNRINEIANAQGVNWPATYELINYKYRPITRFASAKKEDKKNKIQLTKEQKQDFLKRYMSTYLDPNTNQKIEIIKQDVERVIEGRY
ncbi:11705_t:CDS:2 [Gigaspora margarita]|uniref:11705_t:CDS:1 n=1 Tax=Gigaspora margarita TaxID=4874 RepID=A0ABN7UDU9_GIGMA|nr:11705_t:CDS:2 [Gigaspora margarita]